MATTMNVVPVARMIRERRRVPVRARAVLSAVVTVSGYRGSSTCPEADVCSASSYRLDTDGIHDMGGMHGFGPVVVPGSDAVYHEDWEPRVFALSLLIGIEKLGRG